MHIEEFAKIKIKRKFISLVISFSLLAACLLIGLLTVGFEIRRVIGSAIICLCIFAFIFIKSKIIFLLKDKTFSGTVVRKTSRTVLRFEKGGFRSYPKREVTQTRLVVETDDGKRKKIYFDSGLVRHYRKDANDPEYVYISADTYPTGSRVIHYRGSNFLLREKSDSKKLFCPICANTVDKNHCEKCDVFWQ